MSVATPAFLVPSSSPVSFGQMLALVLGGPTVVFHALLVSDRKFVKAYMVPLESARWTHIIGRFGNVVPGLIAASAGSSQFVICPINISARIGPVKLSVGVDVPSPRLYAGTTALAVSGTVKQVWPEGTAEYCAAVKGASDSPKFPKLSVMKSVTPAPLPTPL